MKVRLPFGYPPAVLNFAVRKKPAKVSKYGVNPGRVAKRALKIAAYAIKPPINNFESKFLGPDNALPNTFDRLDIRFKSLKEQAKEVEIKTDDGIDLKCWDIPPKGDNPYIIHCHGAKGSLISNAERIKSFADEGFGVFGLEYRKYAGHKGKVTEKGLGKDADAAYAYLKNKGVKKVGVTGHSMGSAVAIDLASRKKDILFAVVEGPFKTLLSAAKFLASKKDISLPDEVDISAKSTKAPGFLRKLVSMIPEGVLPLNNEHRNIDKVKNIKCELGIVTTKDDAVVPYQDSEDLAKSKGKGVFLDLVEGGNHYKFGPKKEPILRFLSKFKQT